MPAAEPTPFPEKVHTSGASVIHLAKHSAARGRSNCHREEGSMNTPEPSPEQLLAETVEAHFLARHRTLTDEPTAEAYLVTLSVILTMIDGALAQSILGDEQHQSLRGMVEGMTAAPGLV